MKRKTIHFASCVWAIKREHYATAMGDDVTACLLGKNVFKIIDMKDGFWQGKLAPNSVHSTPHEVGTVGYSFAHLPFVFGYLSSHTQSIGLNVPSCHFCDTYF